MKESTQKKDLAQILIEGTKTVYGPEKGEQVKAEFERLEEQLVYRRSAEELTAMVEKICSPEIVDDTDGKSIDYILNDEHKQGKLKVALKGTVNLINKTCWYYPLVGMLPKKYQEKIAKRLGDNPLRYTISNAVAESVGIGAAIGVGYMNHTTDLTAAIEFGFLTGMMSMIFNTCRILIPNKSNPKDFSVIGSFFITLPYYTAKTVMSIPRLLKKAIVDSYSSAAEQKTDTQQRLEQLNKIEDFQSSEEKTALEESEQITFLEESIRRKISRT
ncbi:MAG: hypothetical protein KKA62_00740 [Nanoarchaeota archaeon]|nr:hypothetical protein [Nanoarchaeota archaeon]MBU1644125.1 hypothetical protein [Nanoarchaeota archaeon]MBU1976461.1 hypothetical protein [Nanoarchaeota archaeon]